MYTSRSHSCALSGCVSGSVSLRICKLLYVNSFYLECVIGSLQIKYICTKVTELIEINCLITSKAFANRVQLKGSQVRCVLCLLGQKHSFLKELDMFVYSFKLGKLIMTYQYCTEVHVAKSDYAELILDPWL